ncbi:hypothetical protein IFM89_004802 [Coptis chinensis]|uniref:Pectinesterase n=1 Tax=Coptis chinensis TaxID=261450 RepID=A0A835LYI1_9MAGN|nr:hypothetical protein IFM89_004802 [Coptis chinensis]
MGRALAAGISIIFVVGVIVGIVVTVNHGSGNTSHQRNGGLSIGMKAVETFCDPTDYKETCLNTLTVVGDGFLASSIGFENVAGPEGEQAVAFHSKSDFSALYNYKMHGYQDILYYHTCRQFYKNCEISGTVDFIFGEGATDPR